ncbi:MAG: tripartite tricarboxylate transporter permease [SAR202 cluster bacterium]|jgi:putative tricarboxylic transport membrane protein|nr:tripartite tricarboxylate transporter permease [SAR202 cluster bacterium]
MVFEIISSYSILSVSLIFFGVIFGILVSAIPGLTTTIGVVLLLPFSFYLDSSSSLGLLMGVFVGGMAGGAIPAILINIPGNPASIVTNIDGYPLTKKGQGDFALGLALLSSLIGASIGLILLLVISPQLSEFAIKFGAVEQFALMLLGLTLVSGLSEGSLLKGLISMCLGLMIATIGLDPITASPRYTMQTVILQQGISFIPVMIGMFAIPTILQIFIDTKQYDYPLIKKSFIESLLGIKKALFFLKNSKLNLLRSSLIGTIIGAIPGTGSAIAASISYQFEKKVSKNKNQFGKGAPDGIISPESANSSMTGGALIPMLTLGIPGDPVTAVMLGALMIHGIEPGPLMISTFANEYYGLLGSYGISLIFLLLTTLLGIPIFLKVIKFPIKYLMPTILILCIIGSFALRNSILDIWIMLIFGVFAFYLKRYKFPILPIILAIILGGILEEQFRMSLIISLGDPLIFFKKPISLFLICILILFLIYNFFKYYKNMKN